MPASLTGEDRASLLLARRDLLPAQREEALALLASPLQWDRFLAQIRYHEVYPLVYRNLSQLGFAGVPDLYREQLAALYRQNALRNTFLAEELVRLLRLLQDAAIPAIPWKGLFLSQRLYGDIHMRVCADIDILIPRALVPLAIERLRAVGYQLNFPQSFLADFAARSAIEFPLFRASRECSYGVELQCGLLWESSANGQAMRELWQDARPGSFAQVPCQALSPEWEFLCLAAHAAKHHWQGLKWLMDIHVLAEQGDVCWESVAEKSGRWGWESLVRWSLSICHRLLGTAVPEGYHDEMPPGVKVFPSTPATPNPVQDLVLFMQLSRNPADKARLVLRRLCVPTLTDWRFWRLPSSLAFLYYLLRPLRLGVASVRFVIWRVLEWARISSRSSQGADSN